MTLLCPCESGRNLDQCCGPIFDDPRHAETAEALAKLKASPTYWAKRAATPNKNAA